MGILSAAADWACFVIGLAFVFVPPILGLYCGIVLMFAERRERQTLRHPPRWTTRPVHDDGKLCGFRVLWSERDE